MTPAVRCTRRAPEFCPARSQGGSGRPPGRGDSDERCCPSSLAVASFDGAADRSRWEAGCLPVHRDAPGPRAHGPKEGGPVADEPGHGGRVVTAGRGVPAASECDQSAGPLRSGVFGVRRRPRAGGTPADPAARLGRPAATKGPATHPGFLHTSDESWHSDRTVSTTNHEGSSSQLWSQPEWKGSRSRTEGDGSVAGVPGSSSLRKIAVTTKPWCRATAWCLSGIPSASRTGGRGSLRVSARYVPALLRARMAARSLSAPGSSRADRRAAGRRLRSVRARSEGPGSRALPRR